MKIKEANINIAFGVIIFILFGMGVYEYQNNCDLEIIVEEKTMELQKIKTQNANYSKILEFVNEIGEKEIETINKRCTVNKNLDRVSNKFASLFSKYKILEDQIKASNWESKIIGNSEFKSKTVSVSYKINVDNKVYDLIDHLNNLQIGYIKWKKISISKGADESLNVYMNFKIIVRYS